MIMTLQDFIEKFAEQFEETELFLFNPKTKFRELDEWSSMVTMGLIAMADEEYGVRLRGDELRKVETIEELYQLLERLAK